MPGRKRGAAEGGVAMPRGDEAKKREPRGAGGRSAGSSSEAQAGVRARERPGEFDVVLGENELAYSSYTSIGGEWLGGLFTKCALAPGDVIAKYDGPLLTEAEADVSLSEYLMTAWSVQDKRRRVVIDGHPKFVNLAGFTNYAANQVANADFEDKVEASVRRAAGRWRASELAVGFDALRQMAVQMMRWQRSLAVSLACALSNIGCKAASTR